MAIKEINKMAKATKLPMFPRMWADIAEKSQKLIDADSCCGFRWLDFCRRPCFPFMKQNFYPIQYEARMF